MTTIPEALDATRRALEAEPARAIARVRAEGRLEGGTDVAVRMGAHSVTIDEPKSVGGGGAGPNPVQLVLGSLASCQAITYRWWAEILGIRLDSVTVQVEGDLDLRGFLGFDPDAPAGLATVTCRATVEGPEEPARYEELARAVDAHCPVLEVFRQPVAVEREMVIGGGSPP